MKRDKADIPYQERIRERKGYVYGLSFYLPVFFLLSFWGWIWEMGLTAVYIEEKPAENMFMGPWIPLYGWGGVMLVYLLERLEKYPVAVFFSSMLIGGAIEYVAGYGLDYIWGTRWWDYEGEFLSIQGRVCLWSCLACGLAGWLLVCYGMPYLRLLYRKVCRIREGKRILQGISLILLLFFMADAGGAVNFPHMIL